MAALLEFDECPTDKWKMSGQTCSEKRHFGFKRPGFFLSLVWTVVAASLVLSVESVEALSSCVQDALKTQLQAAIAMNFFTTNRGLQMYEATLGETFTRDLKALRQDQHWVDAGSGDGVAINEYARLQRAKVTGITYTTRNPNNQARTLSGRYLEEIPIDNIGKADLITDFYGVMAYSHSPDEVIQIYTRLLTENGSAYIFLGHFGDLNSTRITTRAGERLTLTEWVQRIPGLRVELVNAKVTEFERIKNLAKSHHGGKFEVQMKSLRITKIRGQPEPTIPRLRLSNARFDETEIGSPIPIREMFEIE